jgi:hypothetical protein
VGLVVIIAHNQGVNIADDISQSVIAGLTALGVFFFPNG